jgi:hypothetical protein
LRSRSRWYGHPRGTCSIVCQKAYTVSELETLDAAAPFGLGATGAAWVFTRSGGVWTQQNKLVNTGTVGRLGTSVALSADGNGGAYGAQDNNLVGSGSVGKTAPAAFVERSIAIVGASNDNAGRGAAAVFTRSRAGSDSQDLATSAASNPAVNFEE